MKIVVPKENKKIKSHFSYILGKKIEKFRKKFEKFRKMCHFYACQRFGKFPKMCQFYACQFYAYDCISTRLHVVAIYDTTKWSGFDFQKSTRVRSQNVMIRFIWYINILRPTLDRCRFLGTKSRFRYTFSFLDFVSSKWKILNPS